MKLVYHLNDLDKVSFALGNIQNHLDGVGGPDSITIALLVHGQALRAFHSASANPDLSKRVGQFSKAGLELAVCGNTMKSQNITLKDLLQGFIVAAWCGSPSCNSRAMFTCGPEVLRFQILPIDANISRRSLIWVIWSP